VKSALICAALSLTSLTWASGAEPARLNVILFMVDDLGWQDTSVPLHRRATPLNQRYRTPHLEQLARTGVRFTNAYASAPVCTPTRASVMTGQSPGRSRITYWTLHKNKDTSKKRSDLRAPAWRMNGLNSTDVTLPALLQANGYRTIHVGKAHFGAHDTSGSDPKNLGFAVNVAGHGSGGPGSFYGQHHFSAGRRQGKGAGSAKTVWDVPGLEKYHGQDIYLTEALSLEAIAAIEDAVGAGQPFYLNFAPYAVHAPIMANRKHLDHYPDLDAKEAAYATMIETVDRALGDIVATVERLGISDQTVFIYTSDNGGLSAHARGMCPKGKTKHTHNAPLRSGKGSAYEGGTRVPTVIRWPGVVNPGTSCATPIISHDFFPTILGMCGTSIPREHAPTVDGVDLRPLLTGSELPERALHWTQPHQWGASGPGIVPFTSIRVGKWKLIYFHPGRRFELYDLANDLAEENDISSERADVVERLALQLDRWITSRGVQLSIDRATGFPIRSPGAEIELRKKER